MTPRSERSSATVVVLLPAASYAGRTWVPFDTRRRSCAELTDHGRVEVRLGLLRRLALAR